MYKGKAIYNPSGKSGEYSYWACNFYIGCLNGCEYCCLKKGLGSAVLGGCEPKLKACFKNETHALDIFANELDKNIDELRKHGLFFSVTTDPMLPETRDLTYQASALAVSKGVQVKILTKCVGWEDVYFDCIKHFGGVDHKELYAFGFTLTGHDELETKASTNAERIEAMKKLHDAGFKIFASIEPVIDFNSSYEMILDSFQFCDLFKIGLESGKKYSILKLMDFTINVIRLCEFNKIYFKDSLLKQAGITREKLPSNCVTRDFNLFK